MPNKPVDQRLKLSLLPRESVSGISWRCYWFTSRHARAWPKG